MKQLLIILFLFPFFSCKTNDKKEKNQQTTKVSNPKKLLPYFEVYKYGHAADTALANGTFIKYLANTDTTDDNLYIAYGNKTFDSIFVWQNGVPATECRTPDLFYGTDKYVALYYNCMNSRGMTLLPLNNKDNIKYFSPIFIDTTRQVVLVEDYEKYHNNNCFDTLTIADFNFEKQKEFVISHMVCGDKLSCIDTVYIDKTIIVLKSAASTSCNDSDNPKKKIEKTEIPWIK